MNNETFASRFGLALRKKGMRQRELANITGIYEGSLSNYIRGKYVPKAATLEIIAKALDVNPAWLKGFDVPMEPQKAETKEKYEDDIQEALSLLQMLDSADRGRIIGRMELMLEGDKYKTNGD